jgi:hypothetical protein
MVAVMQTLTLEQRLQRLEDREEILRTLHQYSHALDFGKDAAEFADCFTDDGVWYSTIEGKWAGTRGVRLEGRAQLAAWHARNAGSRGEPGAFGKHMLVEPDIRLDGDRATVRSYFHTLNETVDGPLPFSMGQYLDVMVRCPDGRWRFQERHLQRESVHKNGQGRAAG